MRKPLLTLLLAASLLAPSARAEESPLPPGPEAAPFSFPETEVRSLDYLTTPAPDPVTPPVLPPVKAKKAGTNYLAFLPDPVLSLLRDDGPVRVFASLAAMQARVERNYEQNTSRDPAPPQDFRFITEDGIVRGSLHVGAGLDWGALEGVGGFVEFDPGQLQSTVKNNRFGYGLYLSGSDSVTLLTYISPVLCVGYRYRGTFDVIYPDGSSHPFQTPKADITNFYLSLNFKVPLSKLFDNLTD